MKIEVEIPDITQEQVVEAMASRLLETRFADFEDGRSADDSHLGDRIAMAVERRIVAIAERLVREHFDAVIKERIGVAVATVLEDGWYKTSAFTREIDEAKANLRQQLDALITGKFTAAIKEALGLR